MYGKHFQSTYSGSMVGCGPTVFAVWGYVIAHTRDSMVELNPSVLAAIIGCSVDEILTAIEVLLSPDPRSRTKDHDGRRLVRHTEFLFFVPTYEKYRNIRNEEERRKYMRDYMRKYRVNTCKPPLAQAEADSEADSEKIVPTALVEIPTESSTQKREAVPFKEIVDLYHRLLPMCPKVEKITKTRQGYIRQRWTEDLKTLDQWSKYFAYVAKSKFLTGKAQSTNGRAPFRADLEWLCRPGNFAKVAEEKYHEVR